MYLLWHGNGPTICTLSQMGLDLSSNRRAITVYHSICSYVQFRRGPIVEEMQIQMNLNTAVSLTHLSFVIGLLKFIVVTSKNPQKR
jgi:hypothetical protein